jgi:enoyl-CoA hydratase/carnithine racemase
LQAAAVVRNKPDKLDAWDRPMRDVVVQALRAFDADADAGVGVAVMTGVGMSRTVELTLTGRMIPAEECHRIGIVHHSGRAAAPRWWS